MGGELMTAPNQNTPPQRFKWRENEIRRWKFGVCVWNCTHKVWEVNTFGHCNVVHFDEDPWEVIGHVVGDAKELVFIDNDFNWIQGVPWGT
jgi:hypothetical protein